MRSPNCVSVGSVAWVAGNFSLSRLPRGENNAALIRVARSPTRAKKDAAGNAAVARVSSSLVGFDKESPARDSSHLVLTGLRRMERVILGRKRVFLYDKYFCQIRSASRFRYNFFIA